MLVIYHNWHYVYFLYFCCRTKTILNMRTFQYYSYRLFLRYLLESDFELISMLPTSNGFVISYDDRYVSELDKLFGSLKTLVEFEVIEFVDGSTYDHKCRIEYCVL